MPEINRHIYSRLLMRLNGVDTSGILSYVTHWGKQEFTWSGNAFSLFSEDTPMFKKMDFSN